MKQRSLLFLFILLVTAFSQQAWAADVGIYVANSGSDNVSVIDPADNTVIATINVGDAPQGVAALADTTTVFVANSGSDNVSVIDTTSNTVTATINVGDGPSGLAATPDDAFVYVSNQSADTVSVIDTGSNTVTATINVGDDPRGVAIHPAGTFAYVANAGDDSVSVIDLSDNTVTETIALAAGAAPRNLAVNNAGTKLYVSGFLTNETYEITIATNTVTDTVAVGVEPLGVVVSNNDGAIYVLNGAGNSVSNIIASSFTIDDTLDATSFPREGVLSSDQATLYTTEQFGDVVSIINIAANTKSTVAVGDAPFGIAFVRSLPALTLSTDTLDFSSVAVDATSDEQTVTLTASGDEDLTIEEIAVSEGYTQTNDCEETLAVGESCTVTITFSPTEVGALEGTLTVTSNAATSPDTVVLTGSGVTLTVEQSTNKYDASAGGHRVLAEQHILQRIAVSNAGADTYGSTSLHMYLQVGLETYYFYVASEIKETESDYTTVIDTYTCIWTNQNGLTFNFDISCDVGDVNTDQTRYFTFDVTAGRWRDLGRNALPDVDNYDFRTYAVYNDIQSASDTITVGVRDQVAENCGCHTGANAPTKGQKMTYLFCSVIFLSLFFSRRFRFKNLLPLLVIFSLAVSSNAFARQTSVNPQVPVLGNNGLVYTLGAKPLASSFHAAMTTQFAQDFLQLQGSGPLIDNQLLHYFNFGYAPNEQLQFDVILPLASYNESGDNLWGFGDMTLRGLYNFWNRADGKYSLAVIPHFTIPTGNEKRALGDRYPRGGFKVAADAKLSEHVMATANLGGDFGEAISYFGYENKAVLMYSAGVSYQARPQLQLLVDMAGLTALNKPFQDKGSSPLEIFGGVNVAMKEHPLAFNAALGSSLVRSGLFPDFKLQAGLVWSFD